MSWTRIAGYPKISTTEAGIRVVDKYYSGSSDTADLPELGDRWGTDGDATLIQRDIDPDDSGMFWFATLVYGQSAAGGGATQPDGVPLYLLENSLVELPLEEAENYLTNWNYNLYATVDQLDTPPGFWETATDTDTGDENYAWRKSHPGTGWKIVAAKTKRAESYPVPAPVVTESRWYRDYESASTAASDMGTKSAPAKTFGKTSGEWLIVGCSVVPDGRRWRVQTRYQWADEWDSDIH